MGNLRTDAQRKFGETIKTIAKILLWLLAALMLVALTFYCLLNTDAFQQKIARKGSVVLSAQLHCGVEVGAFRFLPPNTVELGDVTILDQQSDTMLTAGEIRAKFEFMPLLRKRIIFHQIRLSDGDIRLKHSEKDGNNFDFFIEIFKSRKENDLLFHFGSIQTRNCRLRYESDKEAKKIGSLDPASLDFRNINSFVSIYYLSQKRGMRAEIKDINFTEKSGLSVRSMKTKIAVDSTGVRLQKIALEMPSSVVRIDSASVVGETKADLKDWQNKAEIYADLTKASVAPKDLSSLVPKLAHLAHPVTASGCVKGSLQHLLVSDLSVRYGNKSFLKGYIDITGLPDVRHAFVYISANKSYFLRNDIETFLADLKNRPFVLPKNLRQIQYAAFQGTLSGYLSDIVVSGTVSTNLGNVNADLMLNIDKSDGMCYFDGNVKTGKFAAGKLAQSAKMGSIALNLAVKGSRALDRSTTKMHVKGNIPSFEYNHYIYKNIQLNGELDDKRFEGEINLDDENGKISVDGLLDFTGERPAFNFLAEVEKWNPYKMKLSRKYPDLTLSFAIDTDIEGRSLDDADGNILARDIVLQNGEKTLRIDSFALNSDFSDSLSNIIVTSDFLRGSIEGRYSFSTFISGFKYLASEYVPVLRLSEKQEERGTENNFDFDLNVSNLNLVSDLLGLNWSTPADVNIFGFYDDMTRKFRLRGLVPYLKMKNLEFSDILVSCDNPEKSINIAVDAQLKRLRRNSDNSFGLFFRAWAQNDTIRTDFQWENHEEKLYAGEISCQTALDKNDGSLGTHTDLLPTNIIFSDTVWTVEPSEIVTRGGKVSIKNFVFSKGKENIFVDGTVSKDAADSLVVRTTDIRLAYLEQFLNMNMFRLDGKVSGEIVAHSLLANPDFSASLDVKDFSFNNSLWGDVTFRTRWDKENEKMPTDIRVTDGGKQIASVVGDIFPKQNIGLDIDIETDGLKLDFIGKFMENVLQNMRGLAYTKNLKMIGPLTRPDFDGKVFVENGRFDVDFLRTGFRFSDTLTMTPTSFEFNKIKLYDLEGNSGTVNGKINHLQFRNFTFDIRGNCRNIVALNTKEGDNDMFYGKVYGTGKVAIYGDPSLVNFDIGMRTDNYSKLVIPISSSASASENDFITFASTDTIDTKLPNQRIAPTENKTNIALNLQVEATPSCEIQLVLDPEAGDVIKANGGGNLRIEYKNGEMKLYGEYTLDQGSYLFSLQNIVRRTFKIREGSYVKWIGEPYNPIINVNAYYATTASLLDILDESALTNVKKFNVPVNCLLNISGEMSQPDIKFDVELPNSPDDLNRQVKNVINSEEMMNREALYLLSLGKFYRPDYMVNESSSDGFSTFVASTVSAQLNQWLSKINENLTMGINYHSSSTEELSSSELGVELGASVLNNRLVLNGNVGYRNDITSTQNFVGDFDAEYKINRSGKLRVKAYTHSNNRYYQKNATTQGAGFVYREDFDTFGQLMRDYKEKLFRRKKDKKRKTPESGDAPQE